MGSQTLTIMPIGTFPAPDGDVELGVLVIRADQWVLEEGPVVSDGPRPWTSPADQAIVAAQADGWSVSEGAFLVDAPDFGYDAIVVGRKVPA